MSSTKFINSKELVVNEALDGLVMVNSDKLVRIEGTQIIKLKNPNQNQVSLICGGGSGHEPAHAGYVDPNILTAAVCGGVFASPSHKEVLTAILNVPNQQGVLLIIKNYTGDIINFELAASLARTRGVQVETIVVGEDAAFTENKRGLAGTVLLYKMLGAAANQGMNLQQLKEIGTQIISNMQTLGVSLSSCALPGNDPTFSLAQDEMELGLGIHGEKGRKRDKIATAQHIIKEMLDIIQIKENTQVVALFNNLGSCTDLEMNILAREVLLQLNKKNIHVIRAVEGRLMTSLEMHGFSLTLLPVFDQYVLQLVDAPTQNRYWNLQSNIQIDVNHEKVPEIGLQFAKDKNYDSYLHQVLKKVFNTLIEKTHYFNELDAEVGDGDTGEGFERSSKACLAILHNLDLEHNLVESLTILGDEIASNFGGTSGPLYGVMLSTGARFLKKELSENTLKDLQQALQQGQQQIQHVGKSQVGDRTMVDVLVPLSKALEDIANQTDQQNKKEIAYKLIQVVKEASQKTSQLKAKKGRSRYLDGREIGKLDPGCEVIVAWLTILVENI
ncbi:hypothetical protein ABPG72_005390 [Tetrahymena utriculariae]